MIEIRLHGRGGQGCVEAANMLACAAAEKGYKVLAFAQFGPERRGAPVEAYIKIDKETTPLRVKITEPDMVIIFDKKLTNTKGLKPDGWLVINDDDIVELYRKFNDCDFNVAAINADKIAKEKSMPVNTAMVGAAGKFLGFYLDAVISGVKQRVEKFAPDKIDKNLEAATDGYRGAIFVRKATEKKLAAPKSPIKTARTKPAPPISISQINDMLYNKTGDWRTKGKPIYIENAAPCSNACPAGEDVRGWLNFAKENLFIAAWSKITEKNPFPATCGRVCHHPCETQCNMAKLWDSSVEINCLEKIVGDLGLLYGCGIYPDKRQKRNEKVAILGGGPAGLSCAYQLAKIGYRITIFEASPVLGGMLSCAIPEFRLPKEIIEKEIRNILRTDRIKVKMNSPVLTQKDFYDIFTSFRAICVATGSHQTKTLGIPGENAINPLSDKTNPRVWYGLEFLKTIRLNKAPDFKNKTVVVIGGGNTAIDAARSALLTCKAEKVIIAYRRTQENMPAIKSEIKEALREGVEIKELLWPLEIIHFVANETKQIVFQKMKEIKEKDSNGRNKIAPLGNQIESLKADVVIIAAGEDKTPPLFLPEEMRKSPKEKQEKTDGVFFCGDAESGPSFVSEAIGSGRKTAEKIEAYIERRESAPEEQKIIAGPESLNLFYLKLFQSDLPECVKKCRQIYPWQTNSRETNRIVIKEAERCLSCGRCNLCDNCYNFCPELCVLKQITVGKLYNDSHSDSPRKSGDEYEINYDYCKGCGICKEECPRNVIEFAED